MKFVGPPRNLDLALELVPGSLQLHRKSIQSYINSISCEYENKQVPKVGLEPTAFALGGQRAIHCATWTNYRLRNFSGIYLSINNPSFQAEFVRETLKLAWSQNIGGLDCVPLEDMIA